MPKHETPGRSRLMAFFLGLFVVAVAAGLIIVVAATLYAAYQR